MRPTIILADGREVHRSVGFVSELVGVGYKGETLDLVSGIAAPIEDPVNDECSKELNK